MTTIDVSPVKREGKQPNERYIAASELKIFLANARKRTFKADTFRRWRRVAKVTSREFYSEFEQERLKTVAEHLFDGKKLSDRSLEIKIRSQLSKEKTYCESRSGT